MITILIIVGGSVLLILIGTPMWENYRQEHPPFSSRMPAVQYGMGQEQVRGILGEPSKTQHVEVGGPDTELGGDRKVTEYWYYEKLYQLVFEDGRLTAINRY